MSAPQAHAAKGGRSSARAQQQFRRGRAAANDTDFYKISVFISVNVVYTIFGLQEWEG